MDEQAKKSCWGVTTWTLLGFIGVLTLLYLFGDFDTAVIAAH